MRTYLITLFFALALVACGGGNDVASSGASAVSAAAPASNASPAITQSTPAITATEPKVNGQIDERTGVAPVVAQLTVWTVYSNGGCGNSVSVNLFANGPSITNAQVNACLTAALNVQTLAQCTALGGSFSPGYIYGGCQVQNGPDYYNPVPPPPTY